MKESGQSVQSSQGVMPITQEQYGKDAGLVATTLFGSLVAEKRSLQPRYYWGAADLDELGLTLQTIQEIEEDIDDFRDLTTHATALDLRGLLSGYQETERQKGISEETARDKRRKKLAGNENVFSIMPISDYRPSQMVAERYFNHPSGTPLTSSEIDEVLQDEIEDIIQARTSTQPIAVEHRSSSDYLSPNDQAELQRTRAIIGQYAQTARKLHESSWDEAKKKQPDRLIEEGHPVDNFLNNLPDQLRERRRQEAMSQARRARAEREAQEKAQQQAEVAEGREVVKLESPRVAEVPEIRHGAQLEESPSPLTFESPRIHQEPRTFEATVTQAPDVVVLTEPSQQSREKRIEAEITGAQPKVDLVSPRQVTLEKAHQAQIEGHPDVVKLEVLRVGDRAEVVHEADLSPVAERVELHEPHQVRHEVTAREATVQEASSPVHLEPLVMGEPEARTIEATLAPSEGPVTFQRPEQGQRQAQKKDAQLSPSAEGVTFEAPQPGLHGKEVTNAEISPTQEPLTLSIPNHKDGDLSTHDARLSEASALVDLHEPYAARPTVAPQEAVIHEVSGPITLESPVIGKSEARTIEATLAPSEGPVTLQPVKPKTGYSTPRSIPVDLEPSREPAVTQNVSLGEGEERQTQAQVKLAEAPVDLVSPKSGSKNPQLEDADLKPSSEPVVLETQSVGKRLENIVNRAVIIPEGDSSGDQAPFAISPQGKDFEVVFGDGHTYRFSRSALESINGKFGFMYAPNNMTANEFDSVRSNYGIIEKALGEAK